MASIPLKFSVGSTGLRWSFTPLEACVGGQLVEWRTLGSKLGVRACGVAAADSALVAGVAGYDIRATAATVGDRFIVDAEHALEVMSYGIVPVTFSAAATRGQQLVPTALGKVAPIAAVTTPTAGDVTQTRLICGFCAQDSVASGAVGLAFIHPTGG